MFKTVEQIEEGSPIRAALECLKLIRDEFDQDRWDDIVANVTIVDQETRGDD